MRYHTIDSILHYLPERALYLFAGECVKNFVLEENLDDDVLKEAYRTCRLMQETLWGVADLTTYRINIPLPLTNERVRYAYRLMNECVVMAKIRKNTTSSTVNKDALNFAVSIARMCRTVNGKRSTKQSIWQSQRLEEYKARILKNDVEKHSDVLKKWMAYYAEIAIFEWGRRGRTTYEDMINAVTIMKSDSPSVTMFTKAKTDARRFAATLVKSANNNDPDLNFAVFIGAIFARWYSILPDYSFRYLEEWLGTKETDAFEQKMFDALEEISKEFDIEVVL